MQSTLDNEKSVQSYINNIMFKKNGDPQYSEHIPETLDEVPFNGESWINKHLENGMHSQLSEYLRSFILL